MSLFVDFCRVLSFFDFSDPFWTSDFEEGGAAELGGGALGLGIDRRRCSWWRPAWRVWCGLGASKRCYTSLSQTSTRSRASLQGRRCIVHSRYQVLHASGGSSERSWGANVVAAAGVSGESLPGFGVLPFSSRSRLSGRSTSRGEPLDSLLGGVPSTVVRTTTSGVGGKLAGPDSLQGG